MRKVIIYCRVSSQKQSIYGLSLDDQEFRLRKYCESRGWVIVEIIRETHPAKTFNERKEISRIFREMKTTNCRFDTILCVSFDRYSRDVTSAQSAMSFLKEYNIGLYTLERHYNLHTVAGRREYLADAYRAMDDNMSRASIAERAVKHRMQMGDAPFRVPFGYKKIPGNKHKDPLKRTEAKVVFDENMVHIVKEGFSLVFSGNYSGEAAYKYLNRKYKRKFSKQSFYNMLRNPFYYGKIKSTDDSGNEVLYNGKHPALVSESLWLTVNDRLNERKRNVLEYKARNPEFPLKGFLVCPICNGKLTAGKSKSRNGSYHYYYNCQRKKRPCSFNLKTSDAHAYFSRELLASKFPQVIRKAYKEILRTVFDMDDSERNNRITQIENIVNESAMIRLTLLEYLVEKKILQKDYELKIAEIEYNNAELEKESAKLKAIETSYSRYVRENTTIADGLNDYFWSKDIDCQNELLDSLLDGSIIMEKNAIQHLKFNYNFILLFKLRDSENYDKESSDIQPGVD